jgi:protein tyrosine phosphatase (PTP) superfamily phosphohydrolase (DUF442 family)
MSSSRKTYWLLTIAVVAIAGIIIIKLHSSEPASKPAANQPVADKTENATAPKPIASATTPTPPQIAFVGPRGNVPADAPKDYGFWSFAIPAPGALSRSGQPTLNDFQWLKNNGWKSDIDLRIDGDHNEVSDDADIPGFNALGFHYLKIQMVDGAAPTDQQAEQFLTFATDPANQPVHVHCRGGIGRAGIMVALYRYAVQGWPLDQAIKESVLFQGGIDATQQKWFTKYAASHAPGSFGK